MSKEGLGNKGRQKVLLELPASPQSFPSPVLLMEQGRRGEGPLAPSMSAGWLPCHLLHTLATYLPLLLHSYLLSL